jgi:hypothetical protein
LFFGHEADNRENGESGEKTCSRIYSADYQRLPNKITTQLKIQHVRKYYEKTKLVLAMEYLIDLPVDVVVVLIVAFQSDKGADSQTIREEYLRHGINPHLFWRSILKRKAFKFKLEAYYLWIGKLFDLWVS